MARSRDDSLAAIVKRAKARREADRQWMITFEELAHYFHSFRKGFITDYSEAEDLQQDIWGSSPELARRKLCEFLVACMCPKDRVWPGVKPKDRTLLQHSSVRQWCQQVGQILYAIIYDPEVNFTEKMNELMDDAGTFGTAVPYIDYDAKKRALSLQVKYLKNFSFESDGVGKVTACYCFEEWPLGTIIDKLCDGDHTKLPRELQEVWTSPQCNPMKCYEVLHIIMPNNEFERYGMGPNRFPFKSIWCMPAYLDAGALAEGGYFSNPYPVVRWYRRSKEVWGRSLAMIALPDARLYQSVAAALLEITEKQGNPPMQGPLDILRGEIELFPGGFTAFDSSGFQFQGDPLRPVQLGANPALTSEYLQYLESKIDKVFYADVLALPEQTGKSTLEDQAAWQGRIAQVLAPVFSRVEAEALPPIMDRIVDIAVRKQAFPPKPDELIGQPLEYDWDNVVADMRSMAEAQRDIGTLGAGAQMAELMPEAMENIDGDAFWRGTYGKMKMPEQYLRPMEDVQASREQRQQMQEAAQMAEIAKSAGPGLKSGLEAAQLAQGQQGILPAPGQAQ